MVIDSSVSIAVLLGEPEEEAFIRAIAADRTRLASAATMLESSMVLLGRRGERALGNFRAFVSRAAVQVAPFSAEQVDLAIDAFRRYGKGRHSAGLTSATAPLMPWPR